MNLFDTPLVTSLNKSLDGLWKRQSVINDNMANFETPNYKRKYVSFEDELRSAMEGSAGKTRSEISNNIEQVRTRVDQADDETMRLDGNNVDMEKEQLEMAQTQYNYLYSLRMLNDHFSRLRSAISEGRK